MIRSISFVMVLLLAVATSPLFAADVNCDSATCKGVKCEMNHHTEAAAEHVCPTDGVCEVCHPSELAPQTTCPIMGGAIDKSIYVDHDGQRVYFCCPMCVSKFNADPEACMQTIKENGEEAEYLVDLDG